MLKWTLSEIVDAVGGKLLNEPAEEITVTGVHHDSREIEKGSLFVPIIAERNGHDFVLDAYEKGAVTAFWSEDAENAPTELPLIVVEDTEEAFQEFARYHLKKVNPKVIGITGSNGKTTTKDMTAQVLSAKFKTHKTAGNLNNQLGLPLTLLTMPEETEVAVVEMGMSAPGEIAVLSKLAEPDVAIVTMIGESHIEAFGTREKLADEKVSIIEGLKADGLFIHPLDEPLIAERVPENMRTKTIGDNEKADLFAKDIVEDIEETHFIVVKSDAKDEGMEFTIPVPGKYNVRNALMAILVGLEFGVSLKDAKKQLADLALTKNRLEWLDGKNGLRLLNDAYNASPTSMKSVLQYFAEIETDHDKVAVLGDIRELGDLSQSMHEGIAEAIDLDAFKYVFLYGDEMKYLYDKLTDGKTNEKVFHFTGEKDDLIQTIEEKTEAEDLVLFKSSNGTDLLSVVDALRA